MSKFRKKPVMIDAVQWTGDNFDELFAWGSPDGGVLTAKILQAGGGEDPTKLAIETLEGTMIASVGDWIIRGVKGEFYPCKPDIFAATYEEAAFTPTPAYEELREAWLDAPFDGIAEKCNGEWIQRLLNAVSAIVDPDRTLRETPEAQRRGRLASYRVKHAWWRHQVETAEHHGMAEHAASSKVVRDQLAADCMAEFGVTLE